MDLTSVKYQESSIYISLDGSYEHGKHEESLKELKSVYAVYKIKAFGNFVRDTILIRKKDISIESKQIVVKFELNQLHRPDECEIEIVSLKLIYLSGKREELKVEKSYSLLEIRAYRPIFSARKKNTSHVATKDIRTKKSVLSMTQEVIVPPQKAPETKILIEEPIPIPKKDQHNQAQNNGHAEKNIVIDNIIPLSTVVSEVESNIERKLDAQTKKLEMDIKQLCYETIDLLLTSLPQPELAEDYRASNAMVQSIHKYINADLLQKDLEEGESA